MLTFQPPSPWHGDTLEGELAAAGYPSEVYLDDGTLCVVGPSESDHEAVAAIVAAHPPSAREALAASEAEAANERTIGDRAAAALESNVADVATNDGFLALGSPSNAQLAAQVRELTRQSTRQARQLNALIRLALRRFDADD